MGVDTIVVPTPNCTPSLLPAHSTLQLSKSFVLTMPCQYCGKGHDLTP